jgi:hypothetical protein
MELLPDLAVVSKSVTVQICTVFISAKILQL